MPYSPKVLIVYATWTGHTEEMARLVEKGFIEQDCEVSIFECQQVNAASFLAVDICIVATYTFGRDGELPDEMYGFYDDLKQLNLFRKVYGVLGSGDLYYDYYCRAVDMFSEIFDKIGATKGTENLKIDTQVDEDDKTRIQNFVKEILERLKLMG